MNRRSLLKRALGATAALVGFGVYGGQIEPHWLSVVRRELRMANLPSALVGKTLLQISDIHCGYVTRYSYLEQSLDYAATLKPDFIAYTGDFITEAGRGDDVEFVRLLEHMPLGALGTSAVLGNHDYGRGWREPAVAQRMTQMLQSHGIPVLRNASIVQAGLQFLGMDDLWARAFNASAALAQADPALPTVALCHNPDGADAPGWGWYQGLILSGHTHGGQVRPPFLDAPIVIVNNKRYKQGYVEIGDGRSLYINPGLGYILQFRFNVRPELTLFTLMPI